MLSPPFNFLNQSQLLLLVNTYIILFITNIVLNLEGYFQKGNTKVRGGVWKIRRGCVYN